MPASPCSTRPAAPWGRCASWTRDRAPGHGTNSSGCTMPPGCWDTRWTGGHQDEPERNPTNGGAPPRAGARHTRATVEVAPPADDIWSAAHSRVAQLVEQPAVNRRVAGSSPASGAPMSASRRPRRRPGPPSRDPTPGEIKRTLSLLEATLDSTADGILVVDAASRVTKYNRRFLDM